MAADNQLAQEMGPGIGHNQAPLAERLAEETAPFLLRLGELVGVAETAVIVDDESAKKVVDLIGLIRAHINDVDAGYKSALEPYRAAIRQIDDAYKPILTHLQTVLGSDARSGLRGIVTIYDQKRREAAEAERRRLEEEQRHRDAAAAEARRQLEEKRATGAAGVADELAVMQATDQAARLGRQAEAIRPAPIRAQLGNVGQQRQIAFEITDLRKVVGWLLKSSIRPSLEEAVRQIIGRWLRNLGVAQVQAGVNIPGVEAKIDTVAAVRR